ncbi:unnamed protein product [Urochloa humidicola]
MHTIVDPLNGVFTWGKAANERLDRGDIEDRKGPLSFCRIGLESCRSQQPPSLMGKGLKEVNSNEHDNQFESSNLAAIGSTTSLVYRQNYSFVR